MEENEITPESDNTFKKYNASNFFIDIDINGDYYERIKVDKDDKKYIAEIIFAGADELDKKADDNRTIYDELKKPEGTENFKEIIFIFDYNNLAETLNLNSLEKVIKKFIKKKRDNHLEIKFSLIIQNCLLDDKDFKPLFEDVEKEDLIFNKIEISDELYSFSPNLKTLFCNIKAEELILKKFKFNSKSQLSDFCDFISLISCKKLTLDDFFIELIIKKNENDMEYNDLDIYFTILEGNIVLQNKYTDINSLTLRDCPLFAITGDKLFQQKINGLSIDVDQNSLLNPSIITKFKIEDGKYDICFDLDQYKIRLEEEQEVEEDDNNKNENKENKKHDYIYFLKYIFNILSPNWERKKNEKNNDKKDNDISDSGTKDIDTNNFHKLVFKNFDTTKYEYITGEDVTYIDEKNWVLNEEEKKRKNEFEALEKQLEKANEVNISKLKEVVFDNCSMFFIKWVIKFLKGKNLVHTNEPDKFDFELLKIKKCSKDYVDLSKILKMKIKNLILFDTPLIIGEQFPEKGQKHLGFIEQYGKLGSVKNFTIKINSLDCYAKEYNLNVMKTYEILIEMMESENFNKNLIFELNALPYIMTYLCYIKYVKDQNKYNNPNDDEDGKDDINKDGPQGEEKKKIFEEDVNYLPKYIFISSKKYRDLLISESFKLNMKFTTSITIKNATIKKSLENYENQNYIVTKIQQRGKNNNVSNKMYTTNKELRKMDFGSDGFYIERDFKFFFFENDIKDVNLENVTFSNFRDNNIEGKSSREFETINNLIGKNEFGGSISKYEKMSYPNYSMDFKTFNGIFCVNYGCDNVLGFFRRLMYEKFDKQDELESIQADTDCIKKTFNKFKDNKITLTIIIKSQEEQKEFYCLAMVLDFLITKGILNDKKVKSRESQLFLESKLIYYFNKEKNENDEKRISDFNYYNTCPEETNMVKDKKIKIGDYTVNIKFDYIDEYI